MGSSEKTVIPPAREGMTEEESRVAEEGEVRGEEEGEPKCHEHQRPGDLPAIQPHDRTPGGF